MAKKFTFKTERPTGGFSSFFSDHHIIKYNKKVVGQFKCGKYDQPPFQVSLMVIKKDINEDGNPNCPWKWITFKQELKTLQEAKDWLNAHAEEFLSKYELRGDME